MKFKCMICGQEFKVNNQFDIMQVVIHATSKHYIKIDNEIAKEFLKLLKMEIVENEENKSDNY